MLVCPFRRAMFGFMSSCCSICWLIQRVRSIMCSGPLVLSTIYFLFPLLVLATRKFPGIVVWVFLSAVGYALCCFELYVGFGSFRPLSESYVYVAQFYLGMIAAKYSLGERALMPAAIKRVDAAPLTFVGLFVGMVLIQALAASRFRELMPAIGQSFLVGLAAAVVIFLKGRGHLACGVSPLMKRSYTWLGAISFSLYLVHAPILEMVWRYLVIPMRLTSAGSQAIAMILLGSLASLVFAGVFYQLVERPCHNLSKRMLRT